MDNVKCFVMIRAVVTSSLLAAGNESCPQPQTSEHLAAIEIMKLKHIIILQNKIDLIRDTQAKDQYQEILKFVQGMCAIPEWTLEFFNSSYYTSE